MLTSKQVESRPLSLLLCPAISGGHDILLGHRFRTKLTYTPPLLHASVELGCKKKEKFYRDLQPSSMLGCSRMYIGSVEQESSCSDALHPAGQNFEKSFLPASYVDYWLGYMQGCCKLPRYVPYKGTYVPYDGTFGAPDQGQMLDLWESQTAVSALRNDWTQIVPHHTLEVVLEVTLEHMCTELRPWQL